MNTGPEAGSDRVKVPKSQTHLDPDGPCHLLNEQGKRKSHLRHAWVAFEPCASCTWKMLVGPE